MPRKKRQLAQPAPKRRRGTGSIALRADGRYQAQLPRAVDPQRRARYFSSTLEASRWLDAKLSDHASGARERQAPTLGEWLEDWWHQHQVQLRASTKSGYERALRYLKPIAGVRLSNLRASDIQAVQSDLLRNGYAAQTVRSARAVWAAALNAAVPDTIPSNPMRRVRPPKVERRGAEQAWTIEQANHWLQATSQDRLQALWRLAITIGARPGEIAALRWDDLDLGQSTISIGRTLSRDGKIEGPLKAGRVRRVLMPAPLVDALRRHRSSRPVISPHVFCGSDGLPYNPTWLSRLFQRQRVGSGLPFLTMYGLRHTAATLLVSAGVPVTQVAAMLGHTNTSMTVDVYAHAQGADMDRAASSLAQLLP